ncbi:hypothetical protein ACFLVP_04190 [Chloroflexota bacterium]
MAIRDIINPTADKKIGFYPCCGADALAFFLITNAETGYFVDRITFGSAEQEASLQSVANWDYYWKHKSIGGDLGGGFTWTSVLEAIGFLRGPLYWELEGLGAEDIVIRLLEENLHQVDFDWAYWGEEQKRHRRIYYFGGVDTRFPERYPERLISFLFNGIDFYMEKAAKDHYAQYNAPLDWDQRWDQFNSFTRFNRESVVITTQIPDKIVKSLKMIEDNALKAFERNGARFGVWTAVLLEKPPT